MCLSNVSNEKVTKGKVLILSSTLRLSGQKKEALAKASMQITVVPSYAEGRRRVDQEAFDIIVIDDKLRGSDSYQACRQMRQFSKAPIVLLGRKADKEMQAKAVDLGFHYYFRKPLQPQELITRLKIILLSGAVREEVEIAPQEKAFKMPETEAVSFLETLGVKPALLQPTPAVEPTSEEAITKLWQDYKILRLLDALLDGALKELHPVIDLSFEAGFTYPEADAITETSGKETAQILELLAEEQILLRQPFDRLVLSPEGSAQLVPVERCPYCDSSDLSRGKILEHFHCGYAGLEEDFKTGLKYACPKCRRELKLIGTDYRSPGVRYRCGKCNEIFPAPDIKYRSLKSGKTYSLQELHEIPLYSYHLNQSKRDWLDFELEPKARLIDLLKRYGYEVRESARLQGRSGAIHTLDILATMEDGISTYTLAIGIAAASPGQTEVPIDTLFDFDIKTYDIGIHAKVFIAIQKLTAEGRKFAERQGIRVYNTQELRAMLSEYTVERQPFGVSERISQEREVDMNPDKADPVGWLKRLLESYGYEVSEQAKVKGRSGAEYTLDIYARRDDGIVIHTVAAAVAIAEEGQEISVDEVSKFDTNAFDAGIRGKVFVAVPKLSLAARQLAEHQGIKVIEPREQ